MTAQPWYATPRADWPTAIEAAQEPPTGPASPREVQAALVAAVVAAQQPTLPGKVDGIIGMDPCVLQCRECGETATQDRRSLGAFIILSGFHFCPHEPEPKRRCPDCLAVARAACPVCTSIHGGTR